MTLPLIGTHSRLNVAFILLTGGNPCGTSVYGTGRKQGPNRVYNYVCFIWRGRLGPIRACD